MNRREERQTIGAQSASSTANSRAKQQPRESSRDLEILGEHLLRDRVVHAAVLLERLDRQLLALDAAIQLAAMNQHTTRQTRREQSPKHR